MSEQVLELYPMERAAEFASEQEAIIRHGEDVDSILERDDTTKDSSRHSSPGRGTNSVDKHVLRQQEARRMRESATKRYSGPDLTKWKNRRTTPQPFQLSFSKKEDTPNEKQEEDEKDRTSPTPKSRASPMRKRRTEDRFQRLYHDGFKRSPRSSGWTSISSISWRSLDGYQKLEALQMRMKSTQTGDWFEEVLSAEKMAEEIEADIRVFFEVAMDSGENYVSLKENLSALEALVKKSDEEKVESAPIFHLTKEVILEHQEKLAQVFSELFPSKENDSSWLCCGVMLCDDPKRRESWFDTYKKTPSGEEVVLSVLRKHVLSQVHVGEDVDFELNPIEIYRTISNSRASISMEEAAAFEDVQLVIDVHMMNLSQMCYHLVNALFTAMFELPIGVRLAAIKCGKEGSRGTLGACDVLFEHLFLPLLEDPVSGGFIEKNDKKMLRNWELLVILCRQVFAFDDASKTASLLQVHLYKLRKYATVLGNLFVYWNSKISILPFAWVLRGVLSPDKKVSVPVGILPRDFPQISDAEMQQVRVSLSSLLPLVRSMLSGKEEEYLSQLKEMFAVRQHLIRCLREAPLFHRNPKSGELELVQFLSSVAREFGKHHVAHMRSLSGEFGEISKALAGLCDSGYIPWGTHTHDVIQGMITDLEFLLLVLHSLSEWNSCVESIRTDFAENIIPTLKMRQGSLELEVHVRSSPSTAAPSRRRSLFRIQRTVESSEGEKENISGGNEKDGVVLRKSMSELMRSGVVLRDDAGNLREHRHSKLEFYPHGDKFYVRLIPKTGECDLQDEFSFVAMAKRLKSWNETDERSRSRSCPTHTIFTTSSPHIQFSLPELMDLLNRKFYKS